MTLDELGEDKRAAILAIAARHGVQRVRVFGSFARGDARADSDIDLLIETGPRTPPWFPGGLLVAIEAGATAVIQPGGSVRDNEVIAAANRLGLAMVFTGVRHFRH